ncbi:ARID DNA-binding domain-containing protein [Tanacetum coccineum]
MLRNKIGQINLFNSTLSLNKFRDYTCFYCTQKGHVAKSCMTKLSDEKPRPFNPLVGYGDEGIRCFKDYHRDGNKDGSTAVKKEGRRRSLSGFPRKGTRKASMTYAQKDEKTYATDTSAYMSKEGHFVTECPNEDQRPTNGATTSRQQEEEDTHSSSSEDFTIIV